MCRRVDLDDNNNLPECHHRHRRRGCVRRDDYITCREAARAVYELSREGACLLEQSRYIQDCAEELLEKSFKLAYEIERSCDN